MQELVYSRISLLDFMVRGFDEELFAIEGHGYTDSSGD